MAAYSLVPVLYLQLYVLFSLFVLLSALVYDLLHDRKLEFMRRERKGMKPVNNGNTASALARAIFIDIASSYPLAKCGPGRRASHLFTLWGFLLIILSLLISSTGLAGKFYISPSNPFFILQFIGSLCLLIGTLWYIPQRVNVAFEGNSAFSFNYSDVFLLNLVAIAVFGIATYILSVAYMVLLSILSFSIYLSLITLMFALTHWTKFPHAFYKAGLFMLDRIDEEKGISKLPEPVEKDLKR